MNKPTVKFLTKITALEIGVFKPAKFTPLDEYATVCLEVPLEGKYVSNAEQIISAQLGGGNPPNPVWTLEGFGFILKAFTDVCSPLEMPSNSGEDSSEPETSKTGKIEVVDEW